MMAVACKSGLKWVRRYSVEHTKMLMATSMIITQIGDHPSHDVRHPRPELNGDSTQDAQNCRQHHQNWKVLVSRLLTFAFHSFILTFSPILSLSLKRGCVFLSDVVSSSGHGSRKIQNIISCSVLRSITADTTTIFFRDE